MFGNNSIDSVMGLARDPDKIWSDVNYVLKDGGHVSCVTYTHKNAAGWYPEFENHGFGADVIDAVIVGNKRTSAQ